MNEKNKNITRIDYHRDNEPNRAICERLSIEAIKFLIEKGYDK